MNITLANLEDMELQELEAELDTLISEDENYVRQDDLSIMIFKIKNSHEFINASPTVDTSKWAYNMIKEG